MPLTLNRIPGFADLPDSALAHDVPASGLNVTRISENASFGMVRTEVFSNFYKHGETVLMPVSSFDGYAYQQSELMYMWGIQDSRNPATGWISGPDSLWYGAWDVEQTTGKVEIIEWYRRSGSNDQAAQSNDGLLQVWTVAQRQRTTLTMTTVASAYTDISAASFAVDKAFTEAIAQGLSHNAKFGAVNSEVIYMGEFKNGDTVPRPISPADGYTYTYTETRLQFSWRWSTLNTAFGKPDDSLGQLGPMKAAITASTGAVAVSVEYISDSNTTLSTHGRIAVFALCSRSDLINTIPALANNFAELSIDTFMPGSTLRASALLQLNKNIREAACSPEFFGPTDYQNGNTVPLPTSTLDGYVYTRQEIRTIWEWSDTSPQTGSNLRVAGVYAAISDTSGAVAITTWRLPPGGPYDPTHSFAKIRVTTVAQRGAQHLTLTAGSASNTPGDISSATTDVNGPDKSPYLISIDTGDTTTPFAASQTVSHIIGGGSELSGATFLTNLVGSYFKARHAPTGSISVTIKLGGTTLGSVAFAAAATTGTITWSADQSLVPGNQVDFIMPATPDATFAGFIGTMAGRRS